MLRSRLELDVLHFDVCILSCCNSTIKIVYITVYKALIILVGLYLHSVTRFGSLTVICKLFKMRRL